MSMQYFDNRFVGGDKNPPFLPFFHCCDAFYLQNIIKDRHLKPRPCKVFNNEELLYLFYGRPAYKSSEVQNSKMASFMPTCFILKPGAVAEIRRILPFDSGGFSLYKECMHPGMTLESFLMTPSLESISKTIGYFYKGNQEYLLAKPNESIVYDPLEFQVESYHTLISGKFLTNADDRKASIEVQVNQPIPLTKDSLDAVILPSYLMSSQTVQDFFINELDTTVITIENFGVASSRYYIHLLEKVQEFLTKKYLLNVN
ncbi:hypothetical protein ACFSJU_07555 [Paradesertivirga mongoliensis]|uniref:Uncharacterized protein n=1 Tax=Paradesertivirga mongoliensis TaxID=2100740 RepID=A0ABW4ZJN8_9SPHI|nr:hypothetical protein [Pedobacter mongoliensis]